MSFLNDSIVHHNVNSLNHVVVLDFTSFYLNLTFYEIYDVLDVSFFHNNVHHQVVYRYEDSSNDLIIFQIFLYSSVHEDNRNFVNFVVINDKVCYVLNFQVNNICFKHLVLDHVLSYVMCLLYIFTNYVHKN